LELRRKVEQLEQQLLPAGLVVNSSLLGAEKKSGTACTAAVPESKTRM
jgi:hypothetical protein